MFKKPFATGQSHKVSGADRKKLRRALEKAFGVSEDALEAVLPAKAGEMDCIKLASPSRVVLYVHDGAPILVDPNGKGDYVPTVFALWRLPTMLPQVFVKHPAVTQYIVGGADLMLPGVAIPPAGLPPFQKDGVVAVCCPGNPMPVAVGTATMSSTDAVARAGKAATCKGKLVELVQHYGDCLWADMGGRAIPNEAFLPGAVVPVGMASVEQTLQEVAVGGCGAPGAGEESAWGPDDAAGGSAAATPRDGAAAPAPEGAWDDPEPEPAPGAAGGSSAAAPAGAGAAAVVAAQLGGLDVREGEDSGAGGDDAAAGAGPSGGEDVDMDALLESVLLQALHKSVKDSDLPLNSSVLWNQHMLPVRPAGSSLDVKKSKHKKLSKFLQSYAKAGLLTVKEDKHSGDVILTAVNRKSATYADYRPYRASTQDNAAGAAPADAPAAGGAAPGGRGGATASTSGSSNDELVITEVFRPGRELRVVFEEIGLKAEGLYSAQEAVEAAFAYVKHANLEANAPDNRTIVLDPTLCDALFKGFIKKGDSYPTHLPKADLRDAFMRRMHGQFLITKGAQQVVRKGQPPAVQVSSEKRQGNKRVTKIVGVEAFLVDPEQASSACQKRFACSTTVSELPGKGNGCEVVLQGNFVEEAADFLHKTYGIPKQYFQVKK